MLLKVVDGTLDVEGETGSDVKRLWYLLLDLGPTYNCSSNSMAKFYELCNFEFKDKTKKPQPDQDAIPKESMCESCHPLVSLENEATKRGYIAKYSEESIEVQVGPAVVATAKVDWKNLPQWDPAWSSKDDVEVFIERMHTAKERWTLQGQRSLSVADARAAWTESVVKRMGGQAKVLSKNLVAAQSWNDMADEFQDFKKAKDGPSKEGENRCPPSIKNDPHLFFKP